MTDRDDTTPDPAALDELARAFGLESDEGPDDAPAGPAAALDPASASLPITPDPASDDSDEGTGVVDTDAPPVERAEWIDPTPEALDEPEALLIVEQVPFEAESEPEPTPPRIVRIDDYSGSTVISDGTVDDEATPPVVHAATAIDPSQDAAEPIGDDAVDERAGRDATPGDDGVVVISAVDDLPDAVYVQGSLDRDGDRPIVFIDDDGSDDALAPEAGREQRRGIEPRLRERRAAIKRALGRRRLRWLLATAVLLLVAVGVIAVLGSNLFAIQRDQVSVTGAVYTDEDRLESVIDELVGTPALLVDVDRAERDLEAIPWVDDARVRVSFPHAASIELRERQAIATYQGPDQRYRVLDREGRVLDVLDGYPFAYVLITGPDPSDLTAGAFAPDGYAAAAELAKNLTPSIRDADSPTHLTAIRVTANGSELTLLLDDGTEARFGAARDLFNKLLRLETTLENNPDREPGVIDVSTAEVTL